MCETTHSKKNIHQRYSNEDEPMIKHDLTEGEKFIKLLSSNQLEKTADAEKILRQEEQFVKVSTFSPLPSTMYGLLASEKMSTYCESQKDEEYYKNDEYTSNTSSSKLQQTFNINLGRHYKEEALSMKPDSTETKLLSYYIKNQVPSNFKTGESEAHKLAFKYIINKYNKEETSLLDSINSVLKVRKQLLKHKRPNKKKVAADNYHTLWNERKLPCHFSEQHVSLGTTSLDCSSSSSSLKDANIWDYSSMLINEQTLQHFTFAGLSDETIRKLPKFQNYERGSLSNILYIKNIASKVSEDKLTSFLLAALSHLSICYKNTKLQILNGRMKGQAFITLSNSEDATLLLECINGTNLDGKAVIVNYSKRKQ